MTLGNNTKENKIMKNRIQKHKVINIKKDKLLREIEYLS